MPSPTPITKLALIVYVPLGLLALAWSWFGGHRLAWSLDSSWLSAPYPVRLALSVALGLALAFVVVAATPALVQRTAWARALHSELKKIISPLFGALHVGPKKVFFAWTFWAFVMGLLLGSIFELTGVLWGPVLAHVGINQRNMTFIRRH